ncbi:MAG: VIT1/CCC1 transporter family protein [Alphaproteobacteria bacterium]
MFKDPNYKCTGAIVLGMHDALVSITGTIAGLTFALAERHLIILTAIITSVVASLSMSASSYLSERANETNNAIHAAIYTGIAFLTTSALLILPFIILSNTHVALTYMFLIAVFIIFFFNAYIGMRKHKPFMKKFIEMLLVCGIVSVLAFVISELSKYFLGINL